jgi:hypothetical protein
MNQNISTEEIQKLFLLSFAPMTISPVQRNQQ